MVIGRVGLDELRLSRKRGMWGSTNAGDALPQINGFREKGEEMENESQITKDSLKLAGT